MTTLSIEVDVPEIKVNGVIAHISKIRMDQAGVIWLDVTFTSRVIMHLEQITLETVWGTNTQDVTPVDLAIGDTYTLVNAICSMTFIGS